MSETTDKPTIGERYRRAINSSDLRVRERIQGDSDILMAAGWTSGLGTMLYRLGGEFDEVKGDILKAAANDQTAFLLIMMHLKTLRSTREALTRFAWEMATKRGLCLDDRAVAALAARGLVAWLEPKCRTCTGRGKMGGYDGQPQTACRACGGTGEARRSLGQSDMERAFCSLLLSEMDRMCHVAEGRLQRLLARK